MPHNGCNKSFAQPEPFSSACEFCQQLGCFAVGSNTAPLPRLVFEGKADSQPQWPVLLSVGAGNEPPLCHKCLLVYLGTDVLACMQYLPGQQPSQSWTLVAKECHTLEVRKISTLMNEYC